MAARSISNQVGSLLQRRVAEQKTRGTPSSDVEAAALFESIAIAFLTNPRAALYVAHLARNGLLTTANQELAQIDELSSAIRDLTNVTFAVKDTSALQRAKISLLQIEQQQKINAASSSFKKFQTSVNDFLIQQLAPNVRRPGTTDLTRPGAEASGDMATAFTALEGLHATLLDQLYALAVGVENFLASPLSLIIGQTTSARIRADLDDLIATFKTDDSGGTSRDAVIRLLSSTAAMETLGTFPSVLAPVIDSVQSLPQGYSITAELDEAFPTSTSNPGPFSPSSSAGLTVTTTSTITASLFPQTDFDIASSSYIVGALVGFPVSINPGESLFLKVGALPSFNPTFSLQADGTYTSTDPTLGAGWVLEVNGNYAKTVRLNLNAGGSAVSLSLSTVLGIVNSDPSSFFLASEYVRSGTSRIVIASSSPSLDFLTIVPAHTEPSTSTVGAVNVFTSSAHAKLGFTLGQMGTPNSLSVIYVRDALSLVFSSLVSTRLNSDGSLSLTSLDGSPSSVMTVSGLFASVIGIDGVFKGSSASMFLKGSVLGVATDPISPISLLDVGDTVITPAGSSTVAGVTNEAVLLANTLPTFDGNITVVSSLLLAWQTFDPAVQAFLSEWLAADFSKDLTTIDRLIAPLAGSATPAQQNAALNGLAALRSKVSDLVTALSAGPLLATAASKEKSLVQGVIATLLERKYDRALQLLLRCQLQELFTSDWQTASFGGAVQKSMQDIARTDLKFPNQNLGEGDKANAHNRDQGFQP